MRVLTLDDTPLLDEEMILCYICSMYSQSNAAFHRIFYGEQPRSDQDEIKNQTRIKGGYQSLYLLFSDQREQVKKLVGFEYSTIDGIIEVESLLERYNVQRGDLFRYDPRKEQLSLTHNTLQ